MPGPPTPISACPLKRLEIHNGVKPTVFESTHPSSSLSLTIDRQKTVDEAEHALVLLVHRGAQRMLSIRLSDLLRSYRGELEAISSDKRLQRIRIKIQEQNHTIYADFEEPRDFNVTICVLQMSGFHLKDILGCSIQPEVDAAASSTSVSSKTAADLGPRLSSITPLMGPDLPTPPGLAQGTLANPPGYHQVPASSDLQSQVPMAGSQYQGWPGWPGWPGAAPASPSVQPPSLSQLTARIPQLNPYNVFLGNQNHENYRPRVSSPLRSSFHPGEMTRQLSIPDYDSKAYSYPSASLSRRAVSLSTETSTAQDDPWWAPNHGQIVPQSHGPASSQGLPASGVTKDDLPVKGKKRPTSAEEFRRMLPQPRSLPFVRPAEQRRPDDPSDVTEEKKAKPGSKNVPPKPPAVKKLRQRRHNPSEQNPSNLAGTSASKPNLGIMSGAKTTQLVSTDTQLTPSTKREVDPPRSLENSPDESRVGKPTSGPTTRSSPANKPKAAPTKQTKSHPPGLQEGQLGPKRRTRNTIATDTKQENTNLSLRAPPRIIASRRRKETPEAGNPLEPVDAECQTDLDTPVSNPPFIPTLPLSKQSYNRQPTVIEPPILITDSMLRRVNEATSKILDQYELDIKGGCDAEVCAQFYLDKLMAARRDFWHTKLSELERGSYFTPV